MAEGKAKPETFCLFYKKESPFSQHHPSKFKVDDQEFNCAEQYMMYKKAELFQDEIMKKKIMESKSPMEQKKFGRQVHNFDEDKWNAVCEDIVKEASIAKFKQNEHLRKELFATFPKTLVEASPTDCIWGIGMSESNPKAHDKKLWRGKNKLGYILTQVRDELMESL
ncbi:N-glycosidase YbiA-like [Physella acuta]|uniref:N-glycosidase YbiA-like n=1 Tax=Physella acuta TaxID=109671 RepID=UPI0027DC783C|nr:N-glycosidase YbiA-like [Physella acuta]